MIGRPPHNKALLQLGFDALGSGKTWAEASAITKCSEMTLRRHGGANYVGMKPRATKPRENALTINDRIEIFVGLSHNESDATIANRIGKHRSTVWRERHRCTNLDTYDPVVAEADAATKRCRPRENWTATRPHLWEQVTALIRTKKWSPQQISNWLRKEHADESEWCVSHESIYNAIFVQSKGELRKELGSCLRSGRARRVPHGRKAGASKTRIKGMINISERPAAAEDRAVPGHWEGDLIIGTGGLSAVATLVERTTRLGMLIQVDSKDAGHIADRLVSEVQRLPAELFKSLTWDQGTELADHARFSVEAGVDVFFCDPRSPWQRGTNENWNGLVRQFLPKGTDLSVHSQADLDEIARLLNERPRQTLDWDSPAERFNQLVAATV